MSISEEDAELGNPMEDFRDGDIIVASMINPAWLPYFSRAGGFVSEVGGWLSHPAILAREYDVAMIVGTEGIGRIADGGRLRLQSRRPGRDRDAGDGRQVASPRHRGLIRAADSGQSTRRRLTGGATFLSLRARVSCAAQRSTLCRLPASTIDLCRGADSAGIASAMIGIRARATIAAIFGQPMRTSSKVIAACPDLPIRCTLPSPCDRSV